MYIHINGVHDMRYLTFFLILFSFANIANSLELPFTGIYGVKVVDLDSGQTVYEKNANLPLVPASNQKLITLYSALQVLDLEEQVGTSIHYSGAIKKGKLDGDLYFKFRGDPELDQKRFNALMQEINNAGITYINGDVVIDDTEFDEEYFGHGWPVDDTRFCYSAPISPIIYNRNCYFVNVHTRSNGELDFSSETKPYTFDIINRSQQIDFDKYCKLELKAYGDNSYSITGCYEAKNFPMLLKIAVQNPRKNIANVISAFLRSNNIRYKAIAFDQMPFKIQELASTDSRPIRSLLYNMSKDSNNMYAEVIFKKISASATGYSGSWNNSAMLTKELLVNNLNLDPSTFSLEDGSGLSKKNLVAPSVFTALLVNAYNDQSIIDYFMETLPISGFDGTLKGRFKNSFLKDKIYAKTGTADHNSALSGYAFLDNKRKYAFSIMVNNYTVAASEAKRFEEKLLEHIFENFVN